MLTKHIVLNALSASTASARESSTLYPRRGIFELYG